MLNALYWIWSGEFYSEVEKANGMLGSVIKACSRRNHEVTPRSKTAPKQRTETVQGATVHHRQQVRGVVMPGREKERTFKYLTFGKFNQLHFAF